MTVMLAALAMGIKDVARTLNLTRQLRFRSPMQNKHPHSTSSSVVSASGLSICYGCGHLWCMRTSRIEIQVSSLPTTIVRFHDSVEPIFANISSTSCSVKCFKVHIPTHDEDDAGKSDGTQEAHRERPSTAGVKDPNLPQVEQELVKPGSDVAPLQSGQEDQGGDPKLQHPFEAVRRDPRFKPLFQKYPSLRSKLQKIYEMTWEPTRFGPANPAEIAKGETPRYVSPHMKGQWNQEK